MAGWAWHTWPPAQGAPAFTVPCSGNMAPLMCTKHFQYTLFPLSSVPGRQGGMTLSVLTAKTGNRLGTRDSLACLSGRWSQRQGLSTCVGHLPTCCCFALTIPQPGTPFPANSVPTFKMQWINISSYLAIYLNFKIQKKLQQTPKGLLLGPRILPAFGGLPPNQGLPVVWLASARTSWRPFAQPGWGLNSAIRAAPLPVMSLC